MPENPPIELLYFVLRSYKSPIFLLIFAYFSYIFFWKMAGMYVDAIVESDMLNAAIEYWISSSEVPQNIKYTWCQYCCQV